MPERNTNLIVRTLSQMIRSMRNPNYRVYNFASLTQFVSLSMQMITGPLLIYRLTGSPALLGLMALAGSIPMIVMSIFGGAIADRIQKKKIIITGLIGSTLLALSIGLLLITGIISKENTNSWVILLVGMLCHGSLHGVVMPALQSLVAEIVERDELMNAVAINIMGVNIISLFVPGVAGFMIDAFDFHVIYFTMAGFYTCSIILTIFVRCTRQSTGDSGSILGEIQKGLQYIQRHKQILLVLVFTMIVTLLSQPYQQLMPIYADDILKVGATGMGLLISVSGGGALVASIILTVLPNKRRGLILLVSGLISGLALFGFSFSTEMALSIPMMAFTGIGQTFRVTIGSTLLQAYTEPEYRGRVMSLFHIQWGLTSICTFLAGVLSEVVPVQWVLGSLAMILITFSILVMIILPVLRKLD